MFSTATELLDASEAIPTIPIFVKHLTLRTGPKRRKLAGRYQELADEAFEFFREIGLVRGKYKTESAQFLPPRSVVNRLGGDSFFEGQVFAKISKLDFSATNPTQDEKILILCVLYVEFAAWRAKEIAVRRDWWKI